MKTEIIKILESNAMEGWGGGVEAIGYISFEKVAESIDELIRDKLNCPKCKHSPMEVTKKCHNCNSVFLK